MVLQRYLVLMDLGICTPSSQHGFFEMYKSHYYWNVSSMFGDVYEFVTLSVENEAMSTNDVGKSLRRIPWQYYAIGSCFLS